MKHQDMKAQRRKKRARLKVRKLADRPRLSVFRSNKHIYAQIIDTKGKVLAAANDLKLEAKVRKTEQAKKIGQEITRKALAANIKKVAFDRGLYKYHGRVKALAEGARGAGLRF